MTSTSWHSLKETLLPDRIKAEKAAAEEAKKASFQPRRSILTDRSVSFKYGGTSTPSPDGKTAELQKKTMSKLSPKAANSGRILLVPSSEK
jgi:hypothetical protein